ncbi:hypothetical protein J2R99_000062 [Rhodopseudomonas julia]|uniref:GIY-YIG domain-containing protein n=1 Tax=Rhodopseudomonas julia TaxID=200617 RepID=A0ABU0C114_9BRAD|nr:hypothetical protein [Rhodopseudomonas julia]MDQ0324213.1 hypothetical protein [Rhodopseudomonas julia]
MSEIISTATNETAASSDLAEDAAVRPEAEAAPAATGAAGAQPDGTHPGAEAEAMSEARNEPAAKTLHLTAEDLAPLSFCATDLGSLSVIRRLDGMSGPLSARSAENVVGTARAFTVPFRQFEALREFGVGSGEAVTYILVGREDGETLAYVGETSNIMKRLARHRCDKDKAFAEMVFVVTSKSGLNSKDLARHRQAKYAALIASSGRAKLVGAPPEAAELPPVFAAIADPLLDQERPLLWDLGCPLLEPSLRHPALGIVDAEAADPAFISPEQAKRPMMELAYADLFARGLECDNLFIVLPGSEVRVLGDNGNEESSVRVRRAILEKRGVLTPIPGVTDRQRLNAAVAFWSKSIAARVLAGSHVPSNVWRPIHPWRSLEVVE